jgi:putative tryptophan/tyrosine transport system substrate-binding protein
MAARQERIDAFIHEGSPPADQPLEILCEDHVGTYVIPFLCQWTEGTWQNAKTHRRIEARTLPMSISQALRSLMPSRRRRARNIDELKTRVSKGEEIAAAIDSAQASGATALNTVSSPLFYAHRHLIMERAAAARLPTIYEWPETAEEGGFAAYGPRATQLYAEIMPQQIVKLFRGVKVADIPVEQPTKFELVINLKTAKAMGVTVPEALLARADKVIE